MAAMADPGTGLVSDNVGGDLNPSDRAAYTSPTNIGAYMWSAVVARETGLISAARRAEADRADAEDAADAGEARAVGHVLQLVRPGDRQEAHDLAGQRRRRPPVPVQRRQRLAGDRAAGRHRPGARRWPSRRTRCWTRWTSATTTTRPRTRSAAASGSRTRHRRPAAGRGARQLPGRLRSQRRLVHRPPLRRVQHRAADGQLPRHRRPADPAEALLRHVPHLPERELRLRAGPSRRPVGHYATYLGQRGVRGRVPVPRHEADPDLGRLDVRGADGAAVRARGEVGHRRAGR